VRFNVTVNGGQLVLTVSDDGIGISPQDMPRLFDSFQRGSNVGHIPGTGLGLAIVKQATTCHNGTIAVHSKPGEGACFTVSLPAMPVPST
jgi:signal transduction histidine kinase